MSAPVESAPAPEPPHVRRLHLTVRAVLAALAVVVAAGAALVIFTPLPAPAAGGTCGPSTGSETAAEAFFMPHSIGAGREPANGAARAQWQAFVSQCQSSADVRVGTALALVVVALFLGFVAPGLVSRVIRSRPHVMAGPVAGWYPDAEHAGAWRWWDGRQWGPRAPPPAPPPVPL